MGKQQWFARKRNKMDPSIAIGHACLTCGYTEASLHRDSQNLFCANMLKHGAMGYIGAVDETFAITTPNMAETIAKALIDGNDIGSAFLTMKKNGEIYNRLGQWIWNLESRTEYEPYYVLIGDPTIKLLLDSGVRDEITFSERSAGSRKIIIAHIQQPSEETYTEITGDYGSIRKRAYVNPMGASLAYGERQIEYNDSSSFRHEPRLEEILYTEIDAGFRITGASLKIRYSDGTERDMPLTVSSGEYKYLTTLDDRGIYPVQARVIALRVGDRYKIGISYMEEYMDFSKILPGYSYELTLETEAEA